MQRLDFRALSGAFGRGDQRENMQNLLRITRIIAIKGSSRRPGSDDACTHDRALCGQQYM